MAIKNTSVRRANPYFSGVVLPKRNTDTLTVGSGGVTLTAAQVLSGLLPTNCTDAGNVTLPTAAAINAALDGVEVGTSFDLDFINYGDSTASLVMGTGITNVSIDSEVAVLTVATHQALRVTLVCTGVALQDGTGTDSYNFFGHGVTAAATS